MLNAEESGRHHSFTCHVLPKKKHHLLPSPLGVLQTENSWACLVSYNSEMIQNLLRVSCFHPCLQTHYYFQQLHITGPVFPLNFCNFHSPFNPRFCYSLIQRFVNCERNRFNLIHIKYRFVDHSCSLRMLHNACNWIPNFPSKPISGLMDGYLPYIDSTKLIHPQSKITINIKPA